MTSEKLCCLAALAVGLACSGAAAQETDPPVPGRAIVRVQPDSTIDAVIADLESRVAGVDFSIADPALAGRRVYLLDYEPAAMMAAVEAALEAWENDGSNVTGEWGEILYEGHDPEGRTGSVWFHSVLGGKLFNDQYAAVQMNLAGAHAVSQGEATVVAVVDGGIDAAHPLLQDSIAPGGWNFVTQGPDTTDVGGHGTFVAGLIHLVAPEARLLPVVVLDADGQGDGWILALGMFHAIDRGVEVINMSLGSTYKSSAVELAVEEARQAGIVLVAAAGNQNAGEAFEEFPAADNGVMGIAAVDDLGIKADFSNYHPDMFLSAPGNSAGAGPDFDPERSIYSALPGGDYGVWEGTSFATAFVSGAAALVRAQHPEWPAAEPTADMIAQLLAESAVSVDAQNPDYAGLLGAGRLDAGAAVAQGPAVPTLGDLDHDGVVATTDFLLLLSQWGLVHSSADLDGNGTVATADMLLLLNNWTL